MGPILTRFSKRSKNATMKAVNACKPGFASLSIAAENREVDKGCELTMQMLAMPDPSSVNKVRRWPAGIFATLVRRSEDSGRLFQCTT